MRDFGLVRIMPLMSLSIGPRVNIDAAALYRAFVCCKIGTKPPETGCTAAHTRCAAASFKEGFRKTFEKMTFLENSVAVFLFKPIKVIKVALTT